MRRLKILSSLLVVIFFISFVSFNLGSGHFIQLGSEAWAAGQLYYYNKYNVGSYQVTTFTSDNSAPYGYVWVSTPWYNITTYTGYTFSSTYGYQGTGGRTNNNQGYYIPSPYVVYVYNCMSGSDTLYMAYRQASYTTETVEYQGSLAESNIIAEDGTYPSNGKYSDGYWYVKGSIVNTSPIIN